MPVESATGSSVRPASRLNLLGEGYAHPGSTGYRVDELNIDKSYGASEQFTRFIKRLRHIETQTLGQVYET